jgi:isopentenyl phosphate kinase
LIIIHGAGSGGHQLAKKYGLGDGVNDNANKLYGSLLTRMACQNLDLVIAGIFLQNGLLVTPVHTGSIIIQDNKTITNKSFEIIDQAFKSGCIPMLYGEMAFDNTLGMSVCSGDAIAMTLAKKYDAQQIIFASDIDGIYDKDPHVNRDAELITSTTLDSIMTDRKITLSGSHNIDVTGGLQNKIAILIGDSVPKSLGRVVVCNGLKPGVISKALLGEEVGTVIKI